MENQSVNVMENQSVNGVLDYGVLDLGICNPPMGKLILPGAMHDETATVRLPGFIDQKRVEKILERTWEGEWTFEKQYGFPPPKAVGPYMIVELYTPKLSDVITITNKTRSDQRWISNVGRLISLGSACFKGDQFQHWSESDIPKIGEWIHFKHNAGPVNKFRGIDIVTMYDESINMQLENPEHVTRD